jgi:hypothetical protein
LGSTLTANYANKNLSKLEWKRYAALEAISDSARTIRMVLGSNEGYFGSGFDGGSQFFVDKKNNIYTSNYYQVEKWTKGATNGVIVAGGEYGSGPNEIASISGLYVDENENIFIADGENRRVVRWKAGAKSGVTVAGGHGEGSAANQLSYPSAIVVDKQGNLFVNDVWNHRIQKWAPGATEGITVAGGNGQGSGQNQLSLPLDIYLDNNESLYIADFGNSRIQKWVIGARAGVTVAGGNGIGLAPNQLSYPTTLAVDKHQNIYVADNNDPDTRIQKWLPGASEGILVAAGNRYQRNVALNEVKNPSSLFLDENDNLYVLDQGVSGMRVVSYEYNSNNEINTTFTPRAPGIYTATATANDCTSTSQPLKITSTNCIDSNFRVSKSEYVDGTNKKTFDRVITKAVIYPNPAYQTATIVFTSQKVTKYTLQLTDVAGKVLSTQQVLSQLGVNNITIDVSRYAKGIYFINLIDAKEKHAFKLNKQ